LRWHEKQLTKARPIIGSKPTSIQAETVLWPVKNSETFPSNIASCNRIKVGGISHKLWLTFLPLSLFFLYKSSDAVFPPTAFLQVGTSAKKRCSIQVYAKNPSVPPNPSGGNAVVYFEVEFPLPSPARKRIDHRASAALAVRIHAQTLFHHPFDK